MINMNQALTCLVGLANGPVFRRFTFRQVSFFGSMLVSIALFFTSFADSFIKFLITFSILYGECFFFDVSNSHFFRLKMIIN